MFKKKKLNKILVSETAFNDIDPSKVIASNISVLNVLQEEGAELEELHDDAIISYFVDYYLTQYKEGDFSQFVHHSQWHEDLNQNLIIGLEKIGATKHLELFNELCEKVDEIDEETLDAFIENDFAESPEIIEFLNNNTFFDIDEDLVALNSKWLKNHPDLKALPIEGVFLRIEKFLGKKISKH